MTMTKYFGFGINTFMDPNAQLNGCVNDVANLREMLVRGPLMVDPKNIRLLCDERATRLNIFERLAWCARGWPANPTGAHDKLIIQASCHGSQYVDRNGDEAADGMDECLCPYDFPLLWDDTAPDAESYRAWIGRRPNPQICDDDLGVFLKNIPEGVSTVLIIDACHSGSIDRDLLKSTPRYVAPPFDIASRAMDRVLPVKAMGVKGPALLTRGNDNVHFTDQRHVLISGCRDDQTSADAQIEGSTQGAMTWALLRALQETGYTTQGKQPSWLEVHAYMVNLLRNSGYSQVPQLTGPASKLNGPVFG